MKKVFKLFILLFLPILALKINIDSHGFTEGTYVRIHEEKIDAYRTIEQIYENKIKNLIVKSYYPESLSQSYQTINVAGKSKANCFIKISFNINNSYKNFIECSPIQEFFVIESHKWTPAYLLSTGDTLFAENGTGKIITKIEFIKVPSEIYTLEINNTHTFCVGNDAILTHNIPLPVGALFTIAVSFGEGAAAGAGAGSFFGPVTVCAGIVVGGVIGIAAACLTRDKTKSEYRFEFDANKIEAQFRDNSNKNCSRNNNNKLSSGSANINPEDPDEEKNKEEQRRKDREREALGAQAPGIPTKEVGYEPPKNWDGKKVRHPKTGEVGWPDKKGRVWVPTGHGPTAHGGPHWDVQYPNGIDYDNVYPK